MSLAKSLVCGQCQAELKSMRAAKEHAELTGHSDFAESTTPVITMKCVACGKPCDSKEEQDLHQRHTGHAEFTPVESSLGALAAPSAPTIDAELLKQLVEMGFPQLRAEKALVHNAGQPLDVAVDWLAQHADDPDIDVPWAVPPVAAVPKAPLTEEEKKQKAKELQARLKAQREQQAELEKKRELELEKKRREFGKQAHDILEQQRRQEVQSEEYLRKKQKEADARAMARIQEELRKDRAERGFASKDTTEAQKKEEEVKRIQELRQRFKEVFSMLKAAHEAQAKVAAETMTVYLNNVLNNPTEPKYRKIKLGNQAFQTRVAALTGGVQYLEAAGFVNAGEFLELGEPDLVQLKA
eukprot:EG_transcript_17494